MERYRRASVRRHKIEEKPDFKTKIARQSVVCLVIFGVVLIVGLFKTDTAVKIAERIQNSISYTVDYKEAVKDILSSINNFTKGNETDDIKKTDKAD